ncbi:adenylate kinase family enzyme [Rhizobium tibeticum]|uniref:Adenylate kinase n=1 Tax=Rhizobium tibeticum TaxID=501024 RepID=A0A1H8MEV7_9HYPH|nr:AAA family ATPase [Rhizobium tibeticum]MDP9809223.1 adenylate kinase family enzyme [Rhizobium tibeticum]SEH92448.1 topology modulation protein [Rhizobium tibeticum]SEO15758.1 Adenylate kinase [Rhizobium tibeticum]
MPNDTTAIEDAAEVLGAARRIVVFGCSGGGKSTFSQKLARVIGVRYVSMDREVSWLPGWMSRARPEQRQRIAQIVAESHWIIDGNNPSSLDLRLPRADRVVRVRIQRWLCLWSIVKREFLDRGKTRPDMAPGCLEQMPDWQFISYVWNFERDDVPEFMEGIRRYGASVPVVQLKSRADMARQLQRLDPVD